MKRTIISAITLLLAVSGVFAKDNAAVKSVVASGSNLTVTYNQTSRNGKHIFGNAVDKPVIPFGSVWTAGEGKTAQITFKKDCQVGGDKAKLKAGTYSMFIKPAHGEWIIIFNSKPNLSMASDLDKNRDKVVVSTWTYNYKLTTPVDKLTMTVQSDGLKIEWDDTGVVIPIQFVN